MKRPRGSRLWSHRGLCETETFLGRGKTTAWTQRVSSRRGLRDAAAAIVSRRPVRVFWFERSGVHRGHDDTGEVAQDRRSATCRVWKRWSLRARTSYRVSGNVVPMLRSRRRSSRGGLGIGRNGKIPDVWARSIRIRVMPRGWDARRVIARSEGRSVERRVNACLPRVTGYDILVWHQPRGARLCCVERPDVRSNYDVAAESSRDPQSPRGPSHRTGLVGLTSGSSGCCRS
jgi:hypothetical protein